MDEHGETELNALNCLGNVSIKNNLYVNNTATIASNLTITKDSLQINSSSNDSSMSLNSGDLYIGKGNTNLQMAALKNAHLITIDRRNKKLKMGPIETTFTTSSVENLLTNETVDFNSSNLKNIRTIEVSSTIKARGKIEGSSFNATSDKRLKENIKEFKSEKSILDLPVYKYDFIEGAKDQIGCLAQDLQEICPEIVDINENNYLTIQENKLVYLLLEEVKKLNKRVTELEGR
jgi:hypothetical protein